MPSLLCSSCCGLRFFIAISECGEVFRPFIFKTPIRRQLDPIECGAVCLGIVLQAYGKSVSNHDLRAACCTSRRGSDAANIIEAAHRFNLKATAKKCLASDLKSQAGPAILFFDAAHFVVFEGYFFKKFYINDPARGRYALTLQQLRLRFSNVLIALAKDERFGSCTEIPKSAASSLGTPTKISSSLLGMFFAMLFLTVAAGLGLLLGDADKAARVSGDWLFSGLLLLTGWLVFGWWIFWAYIKRSWLDCAKQDVSYIITGVIKMPYGFFDEIPFSVVSKIVASSPSARFFGTLWSSYRYFFMVVMAMVFLAITAILPWAGLILLATLLVFAMLSLIPARFGRGCQNGFGNISLALSAANDMRAMGQTQLVVDGLMFDSFQRIPVGISCCLLAMPISVALFFYLFSLTVPQAFYDGTLAMSEIFSMLVLAYGFAFSAHKLLMKQAELKDDIAKIDALKREFAARTDQVVIAARSDQNALIELRDVSFSYRGEQAKIVERVNLTILSGQLIGVVGRPRSGKSTLLRLLGNKLTQTDGDIIHYVEHNQKLRIANIDQDADLIKASLKDNL